MSSASSVRELEVHSLDDTDLLGMILAEKIPSGTCVGLVGTLGAGKTRLVQALIHAHGISREQVTSPTFSLIHKFESENARIPQRTLYHLDVYRLRDTDEFYELGIEEFIEQPESLTLIEWADRVSEALPENTLWIEIVLAEANSRRLRFSGRQAIWEPLLNQISDQFRLRISTKARNTVEG